MKILIATDAWEPQVNGVVTTLANLAAGLRARGHEVHVVSPEGFLTIPTPSYPEIPLAVLPGPQVARRIRDFAPDAIHVATEGPIGSGARSHCVRQGLRFTTAYHTSFPEYIHARTRLPVAWTAAWMRRFHAPSSAVLVATHAMRELLESRGFRNVVECPLGVDLARFTPSDERFDDMPRPVFAYVGRVSVEKDIAAFLRLGLPGSKLVVGDGPDRARLQREFPQARFAGYRFGDDLASHYRRADAFVFPSRTDTFGLVMLEAMASGVPVAAFPVCGPREVVTDPAAGILHEDLATAAMAALWLDRAGPRRHAERFPWREAVSRFLECQVPANDGARKGEASAAAGGER